MRKSRQLFSIRRPKLYNFRTKHLSKKSPRKSSSKKSLFEPIISSLASKHKATILILFTGEPLEQNDIVYLRQVVNSLQTFTFGVTTSNMIRNNNPEDVRFSLVNATGDARNVLFQGDYRSQLVKHIICGYFFHTTFLLNFFPCCVFYSKFKSASHRATNQLLTSKIAETLNTNCQSSRELCSSTTRTRHFRTLCTKVECNNNINTDLSCFVNLSGAEQCFDENGISKNKYSVPAHNFTKIIEIQTTTQSLCETGFETKNGTCTDINECEVKENSCNSDEICQNSIASYSCEKIMCLIDKTCKNCSQGICECLPGYKFEPLLTGCVDIDECKNNQLNTCEFGCENTVGSFICKCPDGFILNNQNLCEDFDECSDLASNECEFRDLCENKDQGRGYECFCPVGLIINPENNKTCLDIDECKDKNQCRESYQCFNTYGSYYCACPENYEDIGDFCRLLTTTISYTYSPRTVKPEIYKPTNPPGCLCQNNSKCVPRGVGDFQCICNWPWEGRFCNERSSFGPYFHRKRRKRRGRRQRRRKTESGKLLKEFSYKQLTRNKRKPPEREYHHMRRNRKMTAVKYRKSHTKGVNYVRKSAKFKKRP